MANFIEEFFYGNLDPQARSTKQNKAVQKQMKTLMDNEEKLTAQQNSFLVVVPSDLYSTSLTEIAALVDKYKLISKRAIYMPIS